MLLLNNVIKCITRNECNLTNEDLKNLKILKEKYPEITDLKTLIDSFKDMFQTSTMKLEEWMDKAKAFNIPELNSFVAGIERDINSVKNSFINSYNNGLLEGMVNKVKGIKRTSYGRCKFDLLRIKVLIHEEIYG